LSTPRLPVRVAAPNPQPPAATPSAGPLPDRLPRAPAGVGRVAKVEDPVAPQATLILRQEEMRQKSVALYGGANESEAAGERGLAWLAALQNGDGRWILNNPSLGADAGAVTSDPAGVGLVLLPFLGAGHTHQSGKHKPTVARALAWLVEKQQPDG